MTSRLRGVAGNGKATVRGVASDEVKDGNQSREDGRKLYIVG